MSLEWVQFKNGDKAPSTVQGGTEKNGHAVYCARAEVGGELTCGKMVVEAGGAFIPWGGKEHSAFTYEVLTNPSGIALSWVDAEMGKVPKGAVAGGKSSNGETQYVGRARHDDIWVPGKMIASHGGVLYPYGGKEVGATTYQVLCQEDALAWKTYSNGNKGDDAVQGGEEVNGNKVFCARAEIGGELTPGKMVVEAGGAFIPWGGRENSFFTYEVLCNPNDIALEWVDGSFGSLPPKAVVGGKSKNGELQYVGRARRDSIWVPGKMIVSHGGVLYPYGGKENGATTYQVLCYK